MRLACTLFLVLAAAAQVRTLQDGTPVRLRLNRTISSANAHVGETVDFEITEPVINQNYVVIPKGAVALGRVTKVEVKRRFGRAGALELSIDSVRLQIFHSRKASVVGELPHVAIVAGVVFGA